MKIGIFDPYLDTLGGGEKYVLTAASYLSKNHEVFLFWNNDEVINNAVKRFNIDLSNVKQKDNIFSKDVNLAKRLIESSKYDAIFYLSNGSLPIVATKLYVHFQFPVEWVKVNSLIVKQKIKRVNKFIVNSEYTKTFIDKKFNTNSVILYPPSYFLKEFPKLNYKSKKNQILNVGRLLRSDSGEFFKKQDLLIKSFKAIFDLGFSNWQLILVASYKMEDKSLVDKLKKLIGKYPIKIIENCTQDKLRKTYLESKIYWHASGFGEDLEKSPEKAEHFGISTVEAMINGAVPVVINAGGQREIVEDGKNGFLWDNQEDFIEKTIKVVKNTDLSITLSSNAVEAAKKFSTDMFCSKLDEIF